MITIETKRQLITKHEIKKSWVEIISPTKVILPIWELPPEFVFRKLKQGNDLESTDIYELNLPNNYIVWLKYCRTIYGNHEFGQTYLLVNNTSNQYKITTPNNSFVLGNFKLPKNKEKQFNYEIIKQTEKITETIIY